jgi:hypothetical protein
MPDRAKQGGTVEVKLLPNIATCVVALASSPIPRLASSFVNAVFAAHVSAVLLAHHHDYKIS